MHYFGEPKVEKLIWHTLFIRERECNQNDQIKLEQI